MSFLPANNSLGFTISVADPLIGLEILRNASAAGFGSTRAYSVGPNPDPESQFGSDDRDNYTIADVLNDPGVSEDVQKYADRFIQENLELILRETGLSESDVVRIPSLFVKAEPFTPDFADGFSPFDPPGSPAHYTVPEPGGMVLGAFYPAAVNGVVLGHSYIAANAFGPTINGTDIFQQAVARAYNRAGMDAHFIDDFYSHHVGAGDVHCGSNTLRETAVKWW